MGRNLRQNFRQECLDTSWCSGSPYERSDIKKQLNGTVKAHLFRWGFCFSRLLSPCPEPNSPRAVSSAKQSNLNKNEIKNMKSKCMTTLHIGTSISRWPLRCGLPVITLVLACFALSPAPKALAVSPPPDGGYPGNNTAEGQDAVFSLTSGNNNTAAGYKALYSNTTGHDNTANGAAALQSNTSNANTANGAGALTKNTTGDSNTADGYRALTNNTTGADNVALGYYAGASLTTGSDNVDIANMGVAGESNTIRIGTQGEQVATYVAGIYGATASGGTAVYINSSGQLGTATSSARFKRDIRLMDKESEALLALRPVTFRYKQQLDPAGIPQFGLVAEEVEKVNPDLVVRDADGKPYSVRYEAVNAMLLSEFLKEHKAFLEERSKVEKLEALLEGVNERLREQDAKIQKVSAQLEVSKLRSQIVSNDQ